jgi:multicomponent Na+:H+ antiporter subunit G
MRELSGDAFVLAGAVLILLASIGVVRLPDVFARLHAAAKASSLGIASVLLGTAIHFPQGRALVIAVLAIASQFLTAPVAAHAIGRAAFQERIARWPGTRVDEGIEEEVPDVPTPTADDEPPGDLISEEPRTPR